MKSFPVQDGAGLNSASAKCKSTCDRTPSCNAWTLVNQRPLPFKQCFLHSRIGRKVFARNAESGLASKEVLYYVDRPGNDYKHYQQKYADTDTCRASCKSESRCVAWALGYNENDVATCWLKDRVPAAVDNRNRFSGVIDRSTRVN